MKVYRTISRANGTHIPTHAYFSMISNKEIWVPTTEEAIRLNLPYRCFLIKGVINENRNN